MLSEAAETHNENIVGVSNQDIDEDSSDCGEPSSPVMESFQESGGNEAILKMTNLSPAEFADISSNYSSVSSQDGKLEEEGNRVRNQRMCCS